MPPPAIEGYEFGPYRIDTGERLLHRGNELISLPPKQVDTLLVLVRNAGRMVDKSDLMHAVWPDTFVEEGALTRNISLLRKTLGDTGDEAAYIRTIPKRGYRFVAPVRTIAWEPDGTAPAEFRNSHDETAGPQSSSARSAAKWISLFAVLLLAGGATMARFFGGNIETGPLAPVIVPEKVLAVRPFRSVEKDASQDYFADGMTQALIARLASVRNLRVVSLASEAGGQRNQPANWVLDGTISRSGGRIRIYAELIDPQTRKVHWANSYERNVENVLALESEAAEDIAGEIPVSITADDRKRLRQGRLTKPEALEFYLRGLAFWNRRTEDGLTKAIQYFRKAIAADPTYALAYAGLADSYSLLGSVGTDGMAPTKAMPLAKDNALKAIELDPDLADGHTSLAYVILSYEWDLPAAAREFSRALALNPSSATARHWYSHYFMAAHDLGKATEQMREALQLEPLSPSINIGVGWCLYYSRKYDQAIEQFRSVAEIDTSLPLAHLTLGMAYQQKALFDQAIEEYKRAAVFSNDSPASVAALASVYATAGRLAEARHELAHLEEMSHTRYVPAFYFATVHYAMGDLAKTFEWGWQAVGEHCDYLIYLGVEPRAGRLAGNPQFIRAMKALHR